MTEPRVKRRRYESAARAAAAQETRRRIRAAAADLFVRHGYAATSMKAIAAEAGVSERMVFLVFATKAALLTECVRVAVRGDDESTPMLARERWQAVLEAPPERMLGLLAEVSAELMSRTARLLAVGESVGPEDPLLNEVREAGRAATRSDALEVARAMKRAGALRKGMSTEEAADIIYALAASESLYLRLVEHRGWSTAAYAGALERALAGALGPISAEA
jgi:AcrR family transcriptional regulator